MKPRDHATVEQTLLALCHQVWLDDGECRTLVWLWSRERDKEPETSAVADRFWLAFYRRSPALMLSARIREVRGLANQFKAQDDAAASMSAIHAALANHGLCTAKTP